MKNKNKLIAIWWLRIITALFMAFSALYFGGLFVNYPELAQHYWMLTILSGGVLMFSFDFLRMYLHDAFAWYPPQPKKSIIQSYTGLDYKNRPLFEGDTIKVPSGGVVKK